MKLLYYKYKYKYNIQYLIIMDNKLPNIDSKVHPTPPNLTIDIPPFENTTYKIPKLRPPKKFKIGDIVCRVTRRHLPLTIWNHPQWNDWCEGIKPQWYYPYDYGLGGTSEGSALEGELMIFSEKKVISEVFKNPFSEVSKMDDFILNNTIEKPPKDSVGVDIFDDEMLTSMNELDNIPKAF